MEPREYRAPLPPRWPIAELPDRRLVGGIALVVLGGFLLARQFFPTMNDYLLLVLGVLLLASYGIALVVLGGFLLARQFFPTMNDYLAARRRAGLLMAGAVLCGVGLQVYLRAIGVIPPELSSAAFMLGLALGFGLILLLDRRQGWARYPATIALAIGALSALSAVARVGSARDLVWPLVLIGAGAWILARRRG